MINSDEYGLPTISGNTKIKALTTRQGWKAGDEFIYKGGCEHDVWGWAVHFEGGKPFNLPGETVRDVGTHSTDVDTFLNTFEVV